MGNSKLENYKVKGHSMYPLLRDGQEVEVEPAKEYFVGDIVVVKHPLLRDAIIIKEIASIKDDRAELKSIGEGTTNFGLVKQDQIIGKVILT